MMGFCDVAIKIVIAFVLGAILLVLMRLAGATERIATYLLESDISITPYSYEEKADQSK